MLSPGIAGFPSPLEARLLAVVRFGPLLVLVALEVSVATACSSSAAVLAPGFLVRTARTAFGRVAVELTADAGSAYVPPVLLLLVEVAVACGAFGA